MSQIIKNEEKILASWRKKKIFEKSLKARRGKKQFTFYDGPPFATGLPHYGHIIASILKDIIPRFWTMRGYFVPRRFGWDCHGLPVEYEMEKELGISGKKDIEEKIGIAKFNEACRGIVLRYTKEWRKTVERIGRWVDMDNDYRTMDPDYMESIWWVFKNLYNKNLIYEGYKILPYCPRCATPLSNFEANMPGSYKDITDEAITVRFKLKSRPDTYLLAWTTTPWTLPSNSGLALGPEINYLEVEDTAAKKKYILAKERLGAYYKSENEYRVLGEFKGKDLVGKKYEPLFPYFAKTAGAFRVVAADFVSTAEGTGVVHIAPGFGEDDYTLGQKEGLPLFAPVDEIGCFTNAVSDYAGLAVRETNQQIIKDLQTQKKLVKKENYEHSYPHCWRCETPLIYKAVSTWFVKVTEIKNKILQLNRTIHWMPEHLKEGRFGKWLLSARDWAISRNRYWGTPLPIWRHQIGNSQFPMTNDPRPRPSLAEGGQSNQKAQIKNSKCENVVVIGSVKELEKLSGKKVNDLHRHFIDDIEIKCSACGERMKRIAEVLDCWFESGAMPYAQSHYPFENKKEFEENFPADFIAEGIDQTRGWFYTLLVLSTALFEKPAFRNVIVNGLILAEDGKKMSKRLKNYPEPEQILNKYGADALRYYLATSPASRADELRFSEAGVAEINRKLLSLLLNVYQFFAIYKNNLKPYLEIKPRHILDKWIIARLKELEARVHHGLENYDAASSARPLQDFVNDLSTWYLRRSRERIKKSEAGALPTLHWILAEFAKISAPFLPFMAEYLYGELKNFLAAPKESVHLEDWPKYKAVSKDEKKLLRDMQAAREVVEAALSIRKELGIKVRQPLSELRITNYELRKELLNIIAEEINVRSVIPISPSAIPAEAGTLSDWATKDNIALNTKITQELKEEGYARELIRTINALRKEAGLTPNDKITLYLDPSIKTIVSNFKNKIAESTVSKEIIFGKKDLKFKNMIKIDDQEIWTGVEGAK